MKDSPTPADLFEETENHIYNLMKFDCYRRFLVSELYRDALEGGKENVGDDKVCAKGLLVFCFNRILAGWSPDCSILQPRNLTIH